MAGWTRLATPSRVADGAQPARFKRGISVPMALMKAGSSVVSSLSPPRSRAAAPLRLRGECPVASAASGFTYDPDFVAAYFDPAGLYAFGRQSR